jgi:hypothetical protein
MWSSAVKPLSPISLHFSSYTNILSNLLKWSHQPILFTYILLGDYDLANYKTHCCPRILMHIRGNFILHDTYRVFECRRMLWQGLEVVQNNGDLVGGEWISNRTLEIEHAGDGCAETQGPE